MGKKESLLQAGKCFILSHVNTAERTGLFFFDLGKEQRCIRLLLKAVGIVIFLCKIFTFLLKKKVTVRTIDEPLHLKIYRR